MRKLMLVTVLIVAGCSTIDTDSAKRTGIGAGLGAAGGAIIGAATGRPATGAAAGAVLGGALGAGYDQVTKGDEAKERRYREDVARGYPEPSPAPRKPMFY